MKVELIENKNKKFEPIKLNITIEKLEELIELIKRINISISDLNEIDVDYIEICRNTTTELYKILKKKLTEYGGEYKND